MLRETVSANPDPMAYAALARFLASYSEGEKTFTDPEAGSFSEARTLAGRALAADPKCWVALVALAICDARDEKWSDAVAHGEEAINLGAQDAILVKLLPECRSKVAGGAAEGNR